MLILDSDSDFVEILKGRLEEIGWSVKRIKNLESAKKECLKKKMDVFFLDPAVEVCPQTILAELVQDPQYHHPRLLIHTLSGSRKDIQTMKETGVHFYWIKGHITLAEILRHIKKLV